MAESALPDHEFDVIYILGTARSGSTILEIILSEAPGVFGAGEITFLPKDGFLKNKICSCGSTWSSCDVWQKISGELGLSFSDIQEWISLHERFDRHRGFLNQILSLIHTKEKQKYASYNCSLFSAIKKVTGGTTILDSSKYAGRALALSVLMGKTAKFICLTRSPEGLMNTFKKNNLDEQKSKTPLGVFIYYLSIIVELWLVRFIIGKEKVLSVRYEDLIISPDNVLERIELWSGIDLKNVREKIKNNESFDVGHLITANRLRKQGNVKFGKIPDQITQADIFSTSALKIMNAWKWLFGF